MLKRIFLATVLSAAMGLVYAHDNVQEEFHQVYPIAANGRVAVHNINGSIHVTAWDQNQVKVDAIKHGEDQQALQNAQIVVTVPAGGVDIRTKYPEDCHHCAAVEYTIMVPRGAALDHVESVNGRVTVDGVAGPVKASSVNGDVEVQRAEGSMDVSTVNGRVAANFGRLAAQEIKLHTVNGAIELGVPKNAGMHLKAGTLHGGIHSNFNLPVREAGFGPGASLDSTVGSGGVEVELNSVNGGITLTER